MPNTGGTGYRRSAPLVDWLMRSETRALDTEALLRGLGDRLQATGIVVDRITTGIPILHPQVASSSGEWRRDAPFVTRSYFAEERDLRSFTESPPNLVYQGKGPVRCRLTAPPQPGEFAVLADLRAMGLSDYVALGAPFSDGTIKVVTFATRSPGGFDDDDLAALESIMPAMAMVLEVQTLQRTAATLLRTYVGPDAGARVLAGAVRRGMGETINAAIWICDLRGFTALNEALDRDALLALLNDYFGVMCSAVERHGGEVLKFIGDAMLAIFPIREPAAAAQTCARALAAAELAASELGKVNATRRARGLAEIDYGIGLHIGDAMYGNIGSETRLDFTVIGPAVNLAARVEGLCAATGEALLVSADFAATCTLPMRHVGSFALKGVAHPQDVFAPAP